ncbi:MAG: RNA pseudouridine synthase [Lachnospiraceae bacterium]|nr:RNA pseudouridine synthase [Lachnospiraceae bacterium]MDE6184664.1 RNA pseudouridine synthase [Lachnospiraceae bacterium]
MIVVFKPAGIATQTARIGQQDMVSELKNYLAGKPEHKRNSEPYLGVIHRLDQPVSGILVFAKTKQAAADLSSQVSSGKMHKYYYAVIYGDTRKDEERLKDYIYKDPKTNQSMIVKEDFPNAKKALLIYKKIKTLMILEKEQKVSLVEIELFSGRHHQIRAQFAHNGMPLLGDSKYGNESSKQLGREIGCRNVALSAYKLVLEHPLMKKEMMFEKQPEENIFLPFFTKGI